jgi:hypothetical protein
VLVTMVFGDACLIFPGKRYEDWKFDGPAGQSIEAVRPIRDEIRTPVEVLMADLIRARLTLPGRAYAVSGGPGQNISATGKWQLPVSLACRFLRRSASSKGMRPSRIVKRSEPLIVMKQVPSL